MPFDWSSDVCSRSEEHTSELQSHDNLVCRLLLEKKKQKTEHKSLVQSSASRLRTRTHPVHCVRAAFVYIRTYSLHTTWQLWCWFVFFFFNDTAPPEIYPLSLHDALPISPPRRGLELLVQTGLVEYCLPKLGQAVL